MKAVIFDMDGVMIDSEPLWKIAEVEGFAKVGINLTHIDCEETVGLRIDEVVKIWHQKVGWQNKSIEEVSDDIVSILIREIHDKGKALEGLYEALEHIKQNNLKLALATSSYQNIIEAVMHKLKIEDYFEVIHSAQFETLGKPHPAVFLTTASKLNVNPTDCLVIEDSLNGVIAAKSARMKVVAIPEKSHTYDQRLIIADKIFNSLLDIDIKELKKLW